MELSFGEQIKILLKRKNMTIKELADLYVEKTGMPMSRQNLTQRLRRDNFPEQDMRILAALLGYQVSIQLEPTDGKVPELFPAALAAQEQAQATPSAEALEEAVSDINENSLDHALETSTTMSSEAVHDDSASTSPAEAAVTSDAHPTFQIPEAFRRTRPVGEINPLTGEEYLTNTVRKHPTIEEYVQVYDRTTHEWSDVREDYFWEFQEKKKQMMGKEYRSPIRI